MLKLKLQYFGPLMQRTDSLEKILMLRKIEGRRRRGQRKMRRLEASPTWWTWVWASSRRWWRTGRHGVLHSMGSQRAGRDWAAEQQWHKMQLYSWLLHQRCLSQPDVSFNLPLFPSLPSLYFSLFSDIKFFFHLTPQECAPTKPIDRQFCT